MTDGNEIHTPFVMSALDVKTSFLNKLDYCPQKLKKRIQDFRMRGTTAHINFYLNDNSHEVLGEMSTANRQFLCSTIDNLERSFDPIKYKELPEQPLIEIMYSKEHSHISALVHFVPYQLKEDWNTSSKTQLCKTVVQAIQNNFPGFSDCIEDSDLSSPQDIENMFEIWGGQLHYGEFGLDQVIMRPVPELIDYTTPFNNLFLCSGSMHPGGLLTGVAPRLASKKLINAAGKR